jgi:regulator of protease activity HflC (stomatin/prohibitin superfamily)
METSFLNGMTVTIMLLIIIALTFIFMGVQQVPDGNSRIVERMGKRHKILYPGINVIIPILDKVKKGNLQLFTYIDNGQQLLPLFNEKTGDISLAEYRMDPPKLKLLGKDNSEIHVNCVAYFKIADPMRSVYEVSAFAETFKSIILTTLRQEVGRLDSDTVITSREALSENLRFVLQEASVNWGVRVLRVEIEDIAFDPEVEKQLSQARREELIRRTQLVAAKAEAEQKVMSAEANKKAAILVAEGEKASLITKAEGHKQEKILKAQGDFESQKLEAEARFLLASREEEGRAQGYAALNNAISNNSDAIIALESVKAQIAIAESLGKSNSSLIIPTEAVGLFGAAAAAIKGLKSFANNQKP